MVISVVQLLSTPPCCGLRSHSGLCQSKTLMHLHRQKVFPGNQSEWVEKKGSPVISVGLSSLEEVLRRGSVSDMPTPPSRHQLGTQRQVFLQSTPFTSLFTKRGYCEIVLEHCGRMMQLKFS